MKLGRIVDFWPVVAIVPILFAACGYEPPATSAGNASSGSSSSGKGGAGAGETSASSSSGDGGMGGFVSAASSSVTGSVASAASSSSGNGGEAGNSSSSSSSGSNSGSSSGNPDPTVTCGGGFECPTTGTGVCCASKTLPGVGTCDVTGECKLGGSGVYKMKCDEKADCPPNNYCCFLGDGSACQLDCSGQTVCKDTIDCPDPEMCPQKNVPLNLCVQ